MKKKKEKENTENKKKRALPIRILLIIKRIICKLCGKMRWLVIPFIILFVAIIYIAYDVSLMRYTTGARNNDGNTFSETKIDDATAFSINNDGLAVINCNLGTEGFTTVMNIDTGKQEYANITTLATDDFKSGYIYPKNLVITDENEIYSVGVTSNDNTYVTEESIVQISKDYDYLGSVLKIEYDESDRSRATQISKLNYYDGKVTFACVKRNEVVLYSLDTETKALTVSESYPTDPDGTYTSYVIPIDDTFLFLRSDGNVYNVEFNKPIGESIYKFDINSDENGNFIFSKAVQLNGKIYVTDAKHKSELYCIENRKLEKVLDISDIESYKDSTIEFIDKYHSADSDTDELVICLNNGLLTYSDGKTTDKDLTIKSDNSITVYIIEFLEISIDILFYAMIINLIIRKKTLLYKQLIITVPILLIITIVLGYNLYDYSFKENNDNIEKDLGIICELGSTEFEGYDFTPLLETNENTGAAYQQLIEKLEDLSRKRLKSWSSDYIFSIVYRKGDDSAVVLARNDMLSVPQYSVDDIEFSDDKKNNSRAAVVNKVDDFLDDAVRGSSIYAYERISDKGGNGDFYLKVGTETKSFWTQRRDYILKMFFYFFIIFVSMTALIIITSLYIRRTIKKAMKTVSQISSGDLTARIKYKSKDELGEICSQVNEMGQSLETFFEEKDKTEKFYYKFVPEKFRELLGKENFTDLSLGDASSRELTVLFCDIRSFSINSEIMTAKENFSFVNVIYGKAGPIIRENNGFVDKYIGDAVMALFENADDAVKCGIELYRAIVLDPKTAEELKVSDINIGIGIHSGMAMIGIVGESERLSGTVISDTVNLSSRLESLTKQYKTAMLISKDTVDRISDPESLGLRYLGIIQVAGVNEVKAVYEVLDCLPDDLREKRTSNRADFREAIRLFHLGRRADAVDALQDITDSGRNDHVTDMYLEYIKNMSDDDKGNVFRFVRK